MNSFGFGVQRLFWDGGARGITLGNGSNSEFLTPITTTGWAKGRRQETQHMRLSQALDGRSIGRHTRTLMSPSPFSLIHALLGFAFVMSRC